MGRVGSGDLASWVRANLPRLNREALDQQRTPSDLVDDLNAAMAGLDSPVRCSPEECRPRLVLLGMLGSTAERHSQEGGERPGHALRRLRVGDWPFRRYVATLASRTGGPPRDSLLSYVVWNAPAVHVYLPDAPTPFLTVPGAFPDDGDLGPITFTGDPGERAFIMLVKRTGALEQAANDHLWPICEGDVALSGHAANRHVEAATQFLKATRAEMMLFLQRPELTAPFFVDVLRQFACPWDDDEPYSPPSGAHDYSFIVRDKLLATDHPSYDDHIDQLFSTLDATGQAAVCRALASPTLVERLADELHVNVATTSEAADLGYRHPWLSTYFRLYQASSDVAATHWRMIHKYFVGPMRDREHDAIAVSNRAGSGGTSVETLREYLSTRTNHPMSAFRDVFRASRAPVDVSMLIDGTER